MRKLIEKGEELLLEPCKLLRTRLAVCTPLPLLSMQKLRHSCYDAPGVLEWESAPLCARGAGG